MVAIVLLVGPGGLGAYEERARAEAERAESDRIAAEAEAARIQAEAAADAERARAEAERAQAQAEADRAASEIQRALGDQAISEAVADQLVANSEFIRAKAMLNTRTPASTTQTHGAIRLGGCGFVALGRHCDQTELDSIVQLKRAQAQALAPYVQELLRPEALNGFFERLGTQLHQRVLAMDQSQR